MKISVKAHPKSRQAKVVKTGEASFEVWVREAPDKGKASRAIVEAVADYLGTPKSRVKLVSGAASRDKVLEVL